MSDHVHHVPGALLNIEIITINNVDTIPAMMEKTFCLGQQTLNTQITVSLPLRSLLFGQSDLVLWQEAVTVSVMVKVICSPGESTDFQT